MSAGGDCPGPQHPAAARHSGHQETCAASNTLQRWQLTEVRGGYRLTNAITQMAIHVTADGRMLQYPPDQQQPAVWRVSPH